jgi:hypothetical protein
VVCYNHESGQALGIPEIGNLLDRYAISCDHTNEYIDGSIRIFPMDHALRLTLREYALNVADHLPLIADFTVMEDDD